jgi:hypothetical protein
MFKKLLIILILAAAGVTAWAAINGFSSIEIWQNLGQRPWLGQLLLQPADSKPSNGQLSNPAQNQADRPSSGHEASSGFNKQNSTNLSQEIIRQGQQVSSRAAQTSQHVQQVLGKYVQAEPQQNPAGQKSPAGDSSTSSNSSGAESPGQSNQQDPLYETSLKYARYLYCKQVVEEWERQSSQE